MTKIILTFLGLLQILNLSSQTLVTQNHIEYSYFTNLTKDKDTLCVDILLTLKSTDSIRNDSEKYIFYYLPSSTAKNFSDSANYVFNDFTNHTYIKKYSNDISFYFDEGAMFGKDIKYKLLSADTTLFLRSKFKIFFQKKKKIHTMTFYYYYFDYNRFPPNIAKDRISAYTFGEGKIPSDKEWFLIEINVLVKQKKDKLLIIKKD